MRHFLAALICSLALFVVLSPPCARADAITVTWCDWDHDMTRDYYIGADLIHWVGDDLTGTPTAEHGPVTSWGQGDAAGVYSWGGGLDSTANIHDIKPWHKAKTPEGEQPSYSYFDPYQSWWDQPVFGSSWWVTRIN